jgi:protoporphyrinogen oxidase
MKNDTQTAKAKRVQKSASTTPPVANDSETPDRTVIIGAGPAGLTTAYELSNGGRASIVLEGSPYIGGISRTAEYKGYRFDIGGHRFFTKVEVVDRIWHEVLGDDFIKRSRSSRLLYKKRFFEYPLEPLNVFVQLGPVESLLCALSYAKAAVFKKKPEPDFETYVSNRFGRRLYERFFKAYTEKVWGIPCNELQAEWAAQRIKGMSVKQILLNFFNLRRIRSKDDVIKSLIKAFEYPRQGPGMMWTKMRDLVEEGHSKVIMETPVTRILWEPGRVIAVEAGGKLYEGTNFVSSMPIRDLIDALDPPPPPELLKAREAFSYRDFLTVALITRGLPKTDNNWVYIHDPQVTVGRIQIFNNWSPEMVPEPDRTCYGMEYFCFEGDGLWETPDADLIKLAAKEIDEVGICKASDVLDGTVVRQPKAYPVYDDKYRPGVKVLREFLDTVPNLQLVGRNGMHKYNNQDHSMLTAILAARNIMGSNFDLWRVNIDTDYHEEGGNITEAELRDLESTQPLVPRRLAVV